MVSTFHMAAIRRSGNVGTAIPILDASRRAGVPVREIKRLALLGVVFVLDGMVSGEALPILEQRRAEIGGMA